MKNPVYLTYLLITFLIAPSFSNDIPDTIKKKKSVERLNDMIIFDLFFNLELSEKNKNLGFINNYIPLFKKNNVEAVQLKSNLGDNKEDIVLKYNDEGQLIQLQYNLDRNEGGGVLLFIYDFVYEKGRLQHVLLKDKIKYRYKYLKGKIQSITAYKRGALYGVFNMEYSSNSNKAKLRFDVARNGKITKGRNLRKNTLTWNKSFKITQCLIGFHDLTKMKYDTKGNLTSFDFVDTVEDDHSFNWKYTSFDKKGNWSKRINNQTVIERIITYR